MACHPENLIWIDLEMTGLNPASDFIIEIATIVTDKHLNELAEGPVFAIHQPEAVMQRMDAWNTRQHAESGLWDRVRESRIDEAHAEEATIDFLRGFVPAGCSPMCGNTICQDRRFLSRYMPRLEAYFHYRQIDVSTFKELGRRWNPALLAEFSKNSRHTALADARDSIEELRFYRRNLARLNLD